MSEVEIITLDEGNLERTEMFCGHSPKYRIGYKTKKEWMRKRIREGMRYILLRVNGCNAGLMETVPGEFAWRGVEAGGYLFIHCFWIRGSFRKHGYGQQLLQSSLEDARGLNGVAVVVSRQHWLPTPKIFLKNGFSLADHSDPSFDLLVLQKNTKARLPRFKQNSLTIPPGLTLYKSDHCPYIQNTTAIVQKVGEQLDLPVNIIHIHDAKEAQQCPCPNGTLAYFLNGELLTYHPTGTEKLLEILNAKLDRSSPVN